MDNTPALDAKLSQALEGVMATFVRPGAAGTDAQGEYPRAAIDALGEGGFLGLLSPPEAGGQGQSLAAAAEVIEYIAGSCGSTAMVLLMHYAAAGVIDQLGQPHHKVAVATGASLCSLAFSETGSRSHFWAPGSTATAGPDGVRLDARKSWVTSAGEADLLVWSSLPIDSTAGPMTLWAVPGTATGLTVDGEFDGVGLRGNGSRPMLADGFLVSETARLGDDGAGLDIALGVALPRFLVLSAAFSLGLMEALMAHAVTHLNGARLEHLDATLGAQAVPRAAFADLRVEMDATRAFLNDTLGALGSGRGDAMLRVLQVKLVAAEAASTVSDGVMRLCGGAAFRKDLGIERPFRDALASRVMAPTSDALRDFVGRAALGMELLDAPGA